MSHLFSVIGFVAQVCVIASVASVIVSCINASPATDSSFINVDHPTGAEVCAYVDELGATLVSASSSSDELEMVAVDYSILTVKALKTLCKDHHLKGYSNLRKPELIALLLAQ